MREKIALVNQRYGLEVNGGSELHCRQLAERLKEIYDVEVITTCALDYTTWENHYPEGESEINGVKVRRFKVSRERNLKKFDRCSAQVLNNVSHTAEDEQRWIDEQGPYSPERKIYHGAFFGVPRCYIYDLPLLYNRDLPCES